MFPALWSCYCIQVFIKAVFNQSGTLVCVGIYKPIRVVNWHSYSCSSIFKLVKQYLLTFNLIFFLVFLWSWCFDTVKFKIWILLSAVYIYFTCTHILLICRSMVFHQMCFSILHRYLNKIMFTGVYLTQRIWNLKNLDW